MMILAMEIPTGHVVSRDSIEALYAAHIPGLREADELNKINYHNYVGIRCAYIKP